MRKFVLICVLAILIQPLFADNGKKASDAPFNDHELVAVHRIHMREVFRAGVLADNAPYSFQNGKGVWQGEDIKIARRITKEILGAKDKYLRIVPVSAADWTGQLAADKVDIVLGFSPGSPGADGADFAVPYPNGGQRAPAVRKGNAEMIRWLNDVINRRIEAAFWK